MLKFSNAVRALSLIGAMALSSAAHANLVTNGGFETGTLAGWTESGNVGWGGVGNGFVHNGANAYFNGAVGTPDTISQTLTTVAGSTYHIEFWVSNAASGNLFQFNWDGGAPEISFGSGPSGWTQYAFDAAASSNSTTIAVTIQNDPNWTYVDDISVVPTQQVPEPGSLALVGLALAGVGVNWRRKRTV